MGVREGLRGDVPDIDRCRFVVAEVASEAARRLVEIGMIDVANMARVGEIGGDRRVVRIEAARLRIDAVALLRDRQADDPRFGRGQCRKHRFRFARRDQHGLALALGVIGGIALRRARRAREAG